MGTVLHSAARRSDGQGAVLINWLMSLRRAPVVDAISPNGGTALMDACYNGNLAEVKALVAHGADPRR